MNYRHYFCEHLHVVCLGKAVCFVAGRNSVLKYYLTETIKLNIWTNGTSISAVRLFKNDYNPLWA